MLLIIFNASRVRWDDFDRMRKEGNHIIPENMGGSRLITRGDSEIPPPVPGEKYLEINCCLYTTDKFFAEKVAEYEKHLMKFDPGYYP